MALQARATSSAPPSTRSSPSRLTTDTENSCSKSRMFSSKDPKRFTACSSRSMPILCSNAFTPVFYAGLSPFLLPYK